MPLKPNAEHIPYLAFIPVCGGPDMRHAWQGGIFSLERNFYSHIFIPLVRKKVVNDGKIAFGLVPAMRADPFIYRRKVVKHPVWTRNAGLEVGEDIANFVLKRPKCRGVVRC